MNGFGVDTDRLSARAKDFDDLVARAGKIAADLDEALKGADAAWGTDLVGQSFASAHAGPSAETFGLLSGLADRFGGFGGKFSDAAATYRMGEADAVTEVDNAGRDV